MKLELICDQSDELTIGGFALGIADGVAEEPLQSIQIATIPCHLDSMADGSFHTAGRGLECFRHLWVQYLRNGIDHIHIIDGKQGVKIGRCMIWDLLLYSLVYKQPVYWSDEMIANSNFSVKLETYEYLKI